jgi:lambda family phage portal protein
VHWLDRVTREVAPRWTLRRYRARLALELTARHYEGAAAGRRTQGWNRSSGDPNAATGPFVGRLRDVARDLVRNNSHAESALRAIVDDTVGWGVVAKARPTSARAQRVWDDWAGTTACDAAGQHDLYGLQKLVMTTVVESGEVLVRRRFRLPEDNLPIPLQLQVLEPDVIDTTKTSELPNGGRIVHGVELDAIGRRVAYWLFPEHPGSVLGYTSASSQRVPASGVLHIFKGRRAGQLRGASWFAPVLLRFKDFDEYEDATLMKQKIAACLAVITSDVDGSAPALGTADKTTSPELDLLEPGMIHNLPAGRTIQTVQPPTVREYADYTSVSLRAIAAGLGVTYEDLTGDYTDLPFSAARMSRLRHWSRVEDWRWRLLIPQFCGPVWDWAMDAAAVMGVPRPAAAKWTAPPMAMVEPDKEGLAYQRNIRSGLTTLSEAIRERGYDPDELLAEFAADNAKLDALGIVLDSDPRRMTQGGQMQQSAASAPPVTGDDDDDGYGDGARRLWRLFRDLPEEVATDWLRTMFGVRQ